MSALRAPITCNNQPVIIAGTTKLLSFVHRRPCISPSSHKENAMDQLLVIFMILLSTVLVNVMNLKNETSHCNSCLVSSLANKKKMNERFLYFSNIITPRRGKDCVCVSRGGGGGGGGQKSLKKV